MAVTNYSCKKPRRLLSPVLSALIIISFIAPFSITRAYALGVPQPTYPDNYATTTPDSDPPLGIPSFSWTGVSGATKYRLQVDSEIGFNTPIFLNITTKNRSYTPVVNSLFADGEWYWRVRVEEPAPVGEWSEIMTFTKSWAIDQNKPLLIAPDSDEMLSFFNAPEFSWTPVMGSAKYRLQIATSPDGFNSPISSTDTLTTTVQPNSRLANGEYWWRVIPMDYEAHFGTTSEIRRFTLAYGTYPMDLVPSLLEPEDETFPTFTPTFRWTAVEGAELYRLEYTSDETCDFSVGTYRETRQTSYTPTDTFPNDARYCWRVRVESGAAVGDWSDTWHFQKRWYLQPQLLTPTNLYQNALYPIYSWTPVPGAARYKIEIADNPSFSPVRENRTIANTTYTPRSYVGDIPHYYWRVTPIDGGGNLGLTSAVSEFRSNYDSTAPILVYPQYYYLPNDPNFYGDYSMNPYEDRTVPYPIFIWHRVMNPSPVGGVYASAYRLQVDTTPYFNTIVWEYDTENTIATPTDPDDFIPLNGQDYYWRVCVLNYLGGNCTTDPHAGWSQIWKARFDTDKALPPTSGETPELLRPATGQESVEATPLLEWWPFNTVNQTAYQVELSRDTDFSTYEISQTVNIPAYAPDFSLAQRSLGRTDYGTFYWRVRAYDGLAWGNWSEAGRFQIASQSEWRFTRNLDDPSNLLIIGDDPLGDVPETYDLTSLYAAQSNNDWYLGFNANLTITNMTYVFYIDLDNIDGSGANLPPERAYHVSSVSAHQPEYVIYVDKIDSTVDAQNTWVFGWNGTSWGYGQRLSDIGGLVYTSDEYVMLQLPNGAIGMSQVTGSASVMLFSVDTDSGDLVDTVPSDPQVPGNAQLSRFSAVSDHMNLIYPPSTATGDPSTVPSILPFSWDWPTGSNPANPFAGMKLEVHLDPNYTNLVTSLLMTSDSSYFGENNATFFDDFNGDNIYYWRVQPRYMLSGTAFGSWTSGWSFRRLGFSAQNLQTSVTWSTPTFRWDMVEGAQTYRLQVSTDPNFGSTVINQVTPMTSYTPQSTLAQGVYYWRVQVNRYDSIGNDWSQIEQFSLNLPVPSGLTPINNTLVHYAPTFCWDSILEPATDPILGAWKYRLQVSRDENFSTTYETVDTNNICWTPKKGYADGAYWWHVAMIDGNNRAGSYSPSVTFTKQYPISTLISPVNGVVSFTPTFIWTPVDGAASYRFEVSLFTTFDPLFDSVISINTQFTPTKTYDTDKVYYWRVAIRDRDGNQGPFSDSTIIIGKANHFFLPVIGR